MFGSLVSKLKIALITLAAVLFVLVGAYDGWSCGSASDRREGKAGRQKGFKVQWTSKMRH
jgi:hypothetical protein